MASVKTVKAVLRVARGRSLFSAELCEVNLD